MKQNQNNEVVLANAINGKTRFANDPKYKNGATLVEYTMRFVETDDDLLLVLDKIVSFLEDGFVCMRKYDSVQTVASWNKISGCWNGLDMLDDLKFYDTHYKNCEEAKHYNIWSVCYNTREAVGDLIRRYVYLNNRNLFKVASSEMSTCSSYIVGYLDNLEAIEQLCLQINPADIFSQMRCGSLTLGNGKKLKSVIGLPIDLIQTLNEWGKGFMISQIQDLVRDGCANSNEFRRFFDLLKAFQVLSKKRKIEWTSYIPSSEVHDAVELIKLGCNLSDLTDAVAREALMFCKFKPYDLNGIIRKYRDIYKMLGSNIPVKPKQNVDKWHYIVSRNQAIRNNPRPEEYATAVAKINQRSIRIEDYLIKCPGTEEELYEIGEAYSNCLPTYRDRIIDNGAIIYSMYRLDPMGNIAEDIPSVTFEITPMGDFVQIKTFNDQDVDDPRIVSILTEWKKQTWRKQSA